MATRKPPKQLDPLEALATADPREVIALMLWKNRLRNPDMAVQIDEADIGGFQDCVRYLKVKPQVKIFRPEGLPAQVAVPASPGRRAVPARAATPPKPYVMVVLTDEQGNAIRPVENNEEDYAAAQEQTRIQRYREQAQSLAGQLMNQAKTGEYSLAVMQECAEALVALSRAS